MAKSVNYRQKKNKMVDSFNINYSQCIPANHTVEEIPNSQELTDYQFYNLAQKSSDKLCAPEMSIFGDCSDKSVKDAKDIGTMTDCLPPKNLNLESQCNELFGRIVACEISNFSGKARFDKMKQILEIFQKIDIT